MNLRLFAGLVVAGACLLPGLAFAADLQIGHVAPGAGRVAIFADDVPLTAALDYLDFETVDLDKGTHMLQARDTGTGAVLAEYLLAFSPEAKVLPLLVLAGNGQDVPLEFLDYQRQGEGSLAPSKVLENGIYGGHVLAPYPGSLDDRTLDPQVVCASRSATGGGEEYGFNLGGMLLGFGASQTVEIDSRHESTICTLSISHPVVGAFRVDGTMLSQQTLRMLLVGDGFNAPFQVVVTRDGELVQVADALQPNIGGVIRSPSFWYDRSRPAQGITLYEIPGSPHVFGTWFTHTGEGAPVWYFLDGSANGLPGQRDVVVLKSQRDADAAMEVVGSARLFYLDCNQAELRVVLGNDFSNYRTLRLRRSREISACEVFD